MNRPAIARRSALSIGGLAWLGGVVRARAQGERTSGGARPDPTTAEPHRLPADVTTHHALDLPGRTLHFTATAGAIPIAGENAAPHAELAFVAFQLEGGDAANRPVTFAFNGGPGFASAWLNLGAVGPWRVPISGDTAVPSASPEPQPNAESWLDFTDLVFIDPAGTGYSRILEASETTRFWSVGGDIASLAEAIRRWLDRFDRRASPKYVLGESYGGFRAPRLARELAANQGTGISGLLLISPKLDFGGRSDAFDPFAYAARLPTMAAAARAEQGRIARAQLADVEQYARGDFLLDLVRGETDADAIARRSARVAEYTGLDPALVRRYHGLIDASVFAREAERARNRVGSVYDATITSVDPFPLDAVSNYPDPVLEALKAPVSSAMVTIYENQLNWRPEGDYRLENREVNRRWDWGNRIWNPPQSVSALRTVLALDPHVTVLIAHGLFDLVTPYLETQLLLDQFPEAGIGERIRLTTHAGGHMFYMTDESRVALRDEAARLFVRH